MAFRPRSKHSKIQTEIQPIVRLWLLRLLVPLGGYRNFIKSHGFSDDSIAESLGLGQWIDPSPEDFELKIVTSELRKMYTAAEKAKHSLKIPPYLATNIARLAELVGLSETDKRILGFAIIIKNERLLDDTADYLGELSTSKVFHVLSQLLDVPESEVRASLNNHGVLNSSGLVSVERGGNSSLRRKLEVLSDSFADQILTFETDPVSLLREMVAIGSPAQLDISDYSHISPTLSVLRPHLRQSLVTGRKGVNIFLHGAPGTGKSELAKALAHELGCDLFEVASEDDDGDPVNGERRLRAYRAAQSFFANRRAILLFDEAEDVFNDGDSFFGRKSTAQTRKAWINRTLEDNSVPTLWLSNSIHSLDPAFIRRFDLVFELPVPPKSQRERIIKEACADLLNPAQIARIAEAESLAPAIITKAAEIVRSIRDELGDTTAAEAVELLIGSTLEAQGHKPIRSNDANRLPETYDPAFIQADADLAEVTAGLIQSKSGRLCLYGPPGTGKTAYGRWLAEKIGIPLMVKRASDLMSMWVGENEKNIALAFKEAEREGALLLIDEVDTFLQDRRGAQRGWEVSLVNEMLTQMESFSGVFIASTNLMEGLDQASLRRFDLKVKFDFLASEQGWELLIRHCASIGILPPAPELKQRMAQLKNLSPGDFAAVMRQHRFRPFGSATSFVAALGAECALKKEGHAGSSMGFV